MRNDRFLAALERRMNLPLLVAAASFASVVAVFLVGITLIVSSASSVSFPRSIDAPLRVHDAGGKTVSVSVDVYRGTTGTTETAVLKLERGGRAQVVTRVKNDVGQVGYRPTTHGAR